MKKKKKEKVARYSALDERINMFSIPQSQLNKK